MKTFCHLSYDNRVYRDASSDTHEADPAILRSDFDHTFQIDLDCTLSCALIADYGIQRIPCLPRILMLSGKIRLVSTTRFGNSLTAYGYVRSVALMADFVALWVLSRDGVHRDGCCTRRCQLTLCGSSCVMHDRADYCMVLLRRARVHTGDRHIQEFAFLLGVH